MSKADAERWGNWMMMVWRDDIFKKSQEHKLDEDDSKDTDRMIDDGCPHHGEE